MIRIGVCDGVQFYVEKLSESIKAWAELRSVDVQLEKFKSGEEVLCDVEKQGDFAAVFIDIELNGISGMETALKLREKNRLVSIAFVSRYEQSFKEMFQVYPFLFVEKPISWQRVYQTMDQIVEEQKLFNESFLFRYNRTTFHIDLKQVVYFASEKRMIKILMEDSREYAFYEKLDELEKMLSQYNHRFVRIHKSYLVNLHQIEQFHAKSIVMRNGDTLAVSRDKRNMVCQLHRKLLKENANYYI